ncbi:MAG TPA: hypothetical protein VIV11_07710 [Kofleriaceae bacterium]
MIAILPLVAMSSDVFTTAAMDMPTPSKQRTAQVQLADVLANADSIDSVQAKDSTVTFTITRGDRRIDVVATTAASHEVTLVVERERGFDDGGMGGLTWLVDTMRETIAVTRLDVDEDGAVTLTTDQGMRYMAIPGRGSGGDADVEARWAAEWNDDEG